MGFHFYNRLRLIVPIGKGTCRIRTLDTTVNRDNLVDVIKFWFPVIPQMITNHRQGRLRAYHSLPDYYLLMYDESGNVDGKQKWNSIFKIRAFRNATIEIKDIRTGEVSLHS